MLSPRDFCLVVWLQEFQKENNYKPLKKKKEKEKKGFLAVLAETRFYFHTSRLFSAPHWPFGYTSIRSANELMTPR